jgi:hypothetical protein
VVGSQDIPAEQATAFIENVANGMAIDVASRRAGAGRNAARLLWKAVKASMGEQAR